jgi:Flp pilus assembly protein TadD
MEPTPATDPAMRAELLARLGLPANAGAGHIEAAYRAANAVLDRMPAEEATFVAGQRAELDALRSLLLDSAPAETPAAAPVVAPVVAPAADGVVPVAAPAKSGTKKAVIIGAAALVLLVGGGLAFNSMNSSAVPGISGKPTNTNPSPTAKALDNVKVAALMQNITANPKDFKSYMALADLYFQVGDYKNTAIFTKKAVSLKPNDVTALVADGAAQFNGGNNAAAIEDWQAALKLDPKNVEAHYDLGFAYLSGAKPDMAKVREQWEAVVKLAPNSDIAKNVSTHLDSLKSAGKSSSSTTGQ